MITNEIRAIKIIAQMTMHVQIVLDLCLEKMALQKADFDSANGVGSFFSILKFDSIIKIII